ncbi:MAG TPA: hypothetical protein VGF94_11130 [Kofleriaceae bacterium]|jgi:hypothetical protein
MKWPLAIAAVVWCVLVALCARELYAYETTPGATVAAPDGWPDGTALRRGAGFTLIMFVHPDCPCSRASLAELREIAETPGASPTIEIVFVGGGGDGRSWDLAGRVRRAERVLDPRGAEAARFGALTSGDVVVYAPHGQLAFSGGITGSRGHVGDNVGRRQVLAVLRGDQAQTTHAVFGCAL